MEGNLTINSNKIKLEMCLYTNENPPKKLELNTSGKPLFKGKIIQDLIKSKSEFNRVYVREVSSHFRSGWFFLVVCPVAQSLPFESQGPFDISPEKIKPLVLDKVIIKAKKLKRKGLCQTESTEI